MKNILCFILLVSSSISFGQLLKTNQQSINSEAKYKSELYQKIQLNNFSVTENQKKYDVIHYDITLDLDPVLRTLVGSVGANAKVVVGPLDKMELDLLSNMQVDSVIADGQITTFEHEQDILSINLPNQKETDEIVKVTVYYVGTPSQSGLGSFAFDNYRGKPMIWTLSEPFGARNWWPCKDAPVDKADSVDMRVTVPSEMIVASNGNLQSVTEQNSTKTYWWHEKYPISTYLVSLAIYEYSVSYDWFVYGENDSMAIHFYDFPDQASSVKNANLQTKDMIKFYSDTFGLYPFVEEKYGHAMFLWGGAMEHQTLSSMGGYSEYLIAHELAHQWFGDLITCEDFHHIWLNEGFASYSETLWYEHLYGVEGRKGGRDSRKYYGPGTVYVEDTENDDIFSGNLTYNKASWVLHTLRYYMGDDVFFDFLKIYYDRFQYSTVNTTQFKELAEEVSGLELDTYFQQWIYEEGYPEYEYLWLTESIENDLFKTKVLVTQTQQFATIFELPIDVKIKTVIGDTTIRVFNNQKVQEYEFVSADQPIAVLLDEEEWILRRVHVINTAKFETISLDVADSSANKNGEFEPGEEIELFIKIANYGLPAENVTGTLKTKDPDVSIISGQTSFGDLGVSGESSNQETPFVLSAQSGATSHIVHFTLLLESTNGYQSELSFFLNLGQANLLIVDDDDGKKYESFIQQIAVDASLLAKTWDVKNSQDLALENLTQYQAVLWFTGDDKETSLTQNEQTLITDYLTNGGKLFLSGQNIGYDLVEDGSPADTTFFSSILRAQYIKDNTNETMIIGNRQDPLLRTLALYTAGAYGGANNQSSMDVIAPVNGSDKALTYIPSFEIAGIWYEDEATGAKLIYAAFGLEGIAGPAPSSASIVLGTFVSWLLGTTDVANNNMAGLPNDFVLEQNYPNPFNPNTSMIYFIPKNGKVKATIYNTIGQKVKTLMDAFENQGWNSLEWDGTNNAGKQVSSGLYMLSLEYESDHLSNQTKTVKMLKLQ